MSFTNNRQSEAYYQPLLSTLKYHKIDGLDLDIEEQVPLSCPLNLLRRLNADLGPSFILTMAPVASDLQPVERGLGGFSYSSLDRQATSTQKSSGKLIDWFNAQFYNGWGDASSPRGYNAIVANGYSPSRVVLGVLANPQDGGSGHYSYTTYQNTLNTLRSTYSNFGSATGWEYWDAGERDQPKLKNYEWLTAVPSFSGRGQGDAEPNDTSSPVPDPPVPWPLDLSKLIGAGAGFFDGVIALNRTNGDLAKAADLLGLGDVINGVVDAVTGGIGGLA
jgi:chitinase